MAFDFTQSTMHEIISTLSVYMDTLKSGEMVTIKATDPDMNPSAPTLKSWLDLAELLYCRMLTPKLESDHTLLIRYQKLKRENSFHSDSAKTKEEKYGVGSEFYTIDKLQEPSFLWYYLQALKYTHADQRKHILNLGIHRGDEFLVIKEQLGDETFGDIELVGIDHSPSAIAEAKRLLPYPNVTLLCKDINRLDQLDLKRSDLIISIGTLQSPGIHLKTILMSLVQNHLTPDGALIIAFPNSRWIDGELIYGAKAPNYPYPELSLVIKDIYWIKKYLQQHKFRVTITGKEYLFLTATKIGIN